MRSYNSANRKFAALLLFQNEGIITKIIIIEITKIVLFNDNHFLLFYYTYWYSCLYANMLLRELYYYTNTNQ